MGEIAREQNPKFIVIRTRRARSIDYSCWKAIIDFAAAFRDNGRVLVLTGVREELREVIEDAGMKEVLPPECIVNPTGSAWQAFEMDLEPWQGNLNQVPHFLQLGGSPSINCNCKYAFQIGDPFATPHPWVWLNPQQ